MDLLLIAQPLESQSPKGIPAQSFIEDEFWDKLAGPTPGTFLGITNNKAGLRQCLQML